MRPLYLNPRRRWLDRLLDIVVAVAAGVALGWLAAQGF